MAGTALGKGCGEEGAHTFWHVIEADGAVSTRRWDQPMDIPAGAEAAKVGVGQWLPGLDFGQFSELTVKQYYSNGKGKT